MNPSSQGRRYPPVSRWMNEVFFICTVRSHLKRGRHASCVLPVPTRVSLLSSDTLQNLRRLITRNVAHIERLPLRNLTSADKPAMLPTRALCARSVWKGKSLPARVRIKFAR